MDERVLVSNSYDSKAKKESLIIYQTFFGAEGETRTLAPVSRPTPLAGAPRHQLEYFCKCNVFKRYLIKKRAVINLQPASGGESGIRTHGTLPYDGFQDRSVITTSVSLRIGLVYIIINNKCCQELFYKNLYKNIF